MGGGGGGPIPKPYPTCRQPTTAPETSSTAGRKKIQSLEFLTRIPAAGHITGVQWSTGAGSPLWGSDLKSRVRGPYSQGRAYGRVEPGSERPATFRFLPQPARA